MESKELTDDFLGKVLKSTQTEKPGPDFTIRVMSDIRQIETEKVKKPIWEWKNILKVFGILTFIAAIFIILSPFIGNFELFNPESFRQYIQNYSGYISDLFSGFTYLFEFLKESTLTLTILAVITLLLTIELILKRLSNRFYLFFL